MCCCLFVFFPPYELKICPWYFSGVELWSLLIWASRNDSKHKLGEGHVLTFKITFLEGLAWESCMPRRGYWPGMLFGDYTARCIPAGLFAGCLQLGFGFCLVGGWVLLLFVCIGFGLFGFFFLQIACKICVNSNPLFPRSDSDSDYMTFKVSFSRVLLTPQQLRKTLPS